MDSYQPIFDAVRSKLQGGSISDAIENAFRDSGFSHYAQQAMQEFQSAGIEQQQPSVLYKPRLFIDGDSYCALYGENIQEGCAGFGTTPNNAMLDFNTNWVNNLPPKVV